LINKVINQSIGVLCATVLFQCFTPFHYIHLKHHRYTNDTELDPDVWASEGPWYILPLKWLSLEAVYWHYYLSRVKTRPFWECITTFANLFILYGSTFYLHNWGYTNTLLYAWILPGYLAKAALTFSFDYLPHRHDHHDHSSNHLSDKTSTGSMNIKKLVTRAENEYLATSVVSLYKHQISCLTLPLMYQNYHLIHHLAPYVPFYQYETIWKQAKEELMENGSQIIPIIPDIQQSIHEKKGI